MEVEMSLYFRAENHIYITHETHKAKILEARAS